MIKQIKLYVHPGPPYSTSVIFHCKIDPNWFAWQEAFADCVSLAQITLRANRVGDLGVGWPWWENGKMKKNGEGLRGGCCGVTPGFWSAFLGPSFQLFDIFSFKKRSNGVLQCISLQPQNPHHYMQIIYVILISRDLSTAGDESNVIIKSIQKIARWVPKHWDFLQNIGVLQRRIKFWQKGKPGS